VGNAIAKVDAEIQTAQGELAIAAREQMNCTRDKWCARGNDFRTFLDDFVAALPQIDFPGLNLLATPRLSKENLQGCARISGELSWVS
jgi:hypothetical protein